MPQLAQLEDIIGTVSPPPGVAQYDSALGGGDAIGIFYFLANMIQLFGVVCGLYVVANFLLAAYDYISSNGDTGAHNKVKERLTMSVIGIVMIVSVYMVAGLIGFIFFGNSTYLINPTIYGPA